MLCIGWSKYINK